MPDFELYNPADFDATGTTVALVAGYDGSNDTLLTIQDGPLLNDDILDGDLFNNEVGNDADQFGVATLADGTVIGSLTAGSETRVYAEDQFELTAPGETTITLFAVEIGGVLVGYLPTTPMVPGVTYSYTGSNTVPGAGNETLYTDIEGAVCFARGTRIQMVEGSKPIEALAVGETIRTQDGTAEIRWIGRRYYDRAALHQNPNLLPVCISAGALAPGLPARDLRVSRQHRMLVSSRIVERVCGTGQALISAHKLIDIPGIFVDEDATEVEYFHILFDQHEVIFAEGAPSESLFTGPEALKAMSIEARQELLTIFPELATEGHQPRPACAMPAGNIQKKIVERHLKNNRALLDMEGANPH